MAQGDPPAGDQGLSESLSKRQEGTSSKENAWAHRPAGAGDTPTTS